MNIELMNNKKLQELLNSLQSENITEEDNQPLGRYGRMAMNYLYETNPQRFMILKMQGELIKKMEKVDEETKEKIEEITQNLLTKNPLPKTDDILEKTRHYNSYKLIAEEIVIRERVLISR